MRRPTVRKGGRHDRSIKQTSQINLPCTPVELSAMESTQVVEGTTRRDLHTVFSCVTSRVEARQREEYETRRQKVQVRSLYDGGGHRERGLG